MEAENGPGRVRAPGGSAPALSIAVSLGVAAGLAGSAALTLLGHTERGEWLLFVLAFAAVLPASLLAARALHRRGRATYARAVALGAASTSLVLLARAIDSVGLTGDLAVAGVMALALVTWVAALAPAPAGLAGLRVPRAPRAAALALGLAVTAIGLVIVAFVPAGLLAPLPVAFSLAAAAGVVLIHGRAGGLRLSTRARVALDVLISAAVVLLVIDVVAYTLDGPRISSGAGLSEEAVLPAAQVHLDHYLGPANDILRGRALLVDNASQYGVVGIYAIAAWFEAAPLGYGPLGLLASMFTAAQCLAAFWIMRIAGCGPLGAGAAALVAVVVTVVASFGSPAFFPSTGGLRFGFPFLLILLALVRARRSPSSNPLWLGSLAVVAVASVWSLETLAYVLAAYGAIAAFDAATRSVSLAGALRIAGGHLARGALAAALAHAVFAVATRLFAGDWPDWGWYLEYVRAYSKAGVWSTLAAAWSPVWVLGGIYFASLAGVVAVLATNPHAARESRVPLMAIFGSSATGVAFLTFFVGRSFDILLPFVALPAFIVVAVWLAKPFEALTARPLRRVAVGFAAWLGALLLALAWPPATDRLPRTALAHLVPGGGSLSGDLGRLWDSPPMDPRSPAGERLIEAHFPDSDTALVIAEPDLATEILARTGRSNALPLSIPWQEDRVYDRMLPLVRGAVARLEPGTPMLFQADATAPDLTGPQASVTALLGRKRLTRLLRDALQMIQSRFELEPVAQAGARLEVVRLTRKARRAGP